MISSCELCAIIIISVFTTRLANIDFNGKGVVRALIYPYVMYAYISCRDTKKALTLPRFAAHVLIASYALNSPSTHIKRFCVDF